MAAGRAQTSGRPHHNHLPCTVSIDFLVVPTLTFKILFVLVVPRHDRRKVVHFGVTPNPTAEWTAQQIAEAFPRDEAPRFLIRDRHRTYGQAFRDRVTAMGIMEVFTAPRSPWQNGYVEGMIGSINAPNESEIKAGSMASIESATSEMISAVSVTNSRRRGAGLRENIGSRCRAKLSSAVPLAIVGRGHPTSTPRPWHTGSQCAGGLYRDCGRSHRGRCP